MLLPSDILLKAFKDSNQSYSLSFILLHELPSVVSWTDIQKLVFLGPGEEKCSCLWVWYPREKPLTFPGLKYYFTNSRNSSFCLLLWLPLAFEAGSIEFPLFFNCEKCKSYSRSTKTILTKPIFPSPTIIDILSYLLLAVKIY